MLEGEVVGYRWETTEAVVRQGVVGIVRTTSRETAVAQARAAIDGGLRTVEVPLTNRSALGAIEDLVAEHPDAVIGAGTVLDEAAAVLAIRAGARFLVAPNLNPSVIRAANRYGVTALPGVGSVSEIMQALEAGADLVKLFPATTYAPQWISDVRSALPQAAVVPTGGVRPEDVSAWLAQGAVACALGSSLFKGTSEDIRTRVSELLKELDRG
jgi:2-dehydro-3-deoxyphosphogluconate aldolase/(4S)-4-hydroxy-2-oxoglutarate aldolase